MTKSDASGLLNERRMAAFGGILASSPLVVAPPEARPDRFSVPTIIESPFPGAT
jgi:hypothetical protein